MAVKRLIETFVPENYKIFLDIDRKTKKIKGQVAITGEAKDSVIAFHAKGLHFSKVRAFSVDTNFIENEEDEEIVVKIGETGPLILTITSIQLPTLLSCLKKFGSTIFILPV